VRNHVIFYLPLANGIELVRVLHGARDLEAVLDDEER
jgi:plasmid stabilization system protein ParE